MAWLLTGILGLLVLAGLLGRRWWILDLTSHFRVQYAVILTVVVLASAIFRLWRPALAGTFFLIVNVYLIHPLAAYVPASRPLGHGLRVMAVNVCTANRQYEQLIRAIRGEDPDVIFFLEYTPRWDRALQPLEADYPYVAREPRLDSFGIAAYSRLPWEQAHIARLPGGFPFIRSTLVLAGRRCTLFGCHVAPPVSQYGAKLRNSQFEHLAALVRACRGPCALFGDLNCTPWSPWFQDLLADSQLRDSRPGFGIQPSWPAQRPWWGIPIDHCLLSQHWAVSDRRLMPRLGSDHRGVVVDLVLPTREGVFRAP